MSGIPQTPEAAKRFATLQARAALGGVTLYAQANDAGRTEYIVTRWHLTRQLEDLDAVERWLGKVMGDPEDAEEAIARQRFDELQERAAAVGLTLSRTSQGFVLVTKTHSRHVQDLETIAALLAPKGRATR